MKWRGDILKRIVNEKFRTQIQFCQRMGVSKMKFWRWTAKNKCPKGIHLLKICRILDISPDDLFEEDYSWLR